MYVCRTKNGKAFRNVEYLRLEHDKLQSIECYFGTQASYPSAVSKDRFDVPTGSIQYAGLVMCHRGRSCS